MPIYETPTQGDQQAVNNQQANNERKRRSFQANAANGQYPNAQQGSDMAAAQRQQQAAAPTAPPQPNFAQLQAQGYSRPPSPMAPAHQPPGMPTPAPAPAPAPSNPAPAPQTAPATANAPQGQRGASPGLRATIEGMLANPGQDLGRSFQAQYERAARGIEDRHTSGRRAVDEEMARRGIHDSTIAGGRLHDLNISRGAEYGDLMSLLSEKMLDRETDLKMSAIRNALQLGELDERTAARLADEIFRGQELDFRRGDAAEGRRLQRDLADRDYAFRGQELDFRRGEAAANRADAASRFDREFAFRGSEADRAASQWQRGFDASRTDSDRAYQRWQDEFAYNRDMDRERMDFDYLKFFGPDGNTYEDANYPGAGSGGSSPPAEPPADVYTETPYTGGAQGGGGGAANSYARRFFYI